MCSTAFGLMGMSWFVGFSDGLHQTDEGMQVVSVD